MRKKMFSFKNFVMLFMAIGLLTSIGCSKQDNSNEEVDNLKKEISTLKADLSKDFQAKMDAEIGKLNAEITKLKNADKVDPKELDNKYVSKAMYETFKTNVMAEIDAAASKEALGKIETSINSLEGRVAALEGLLGLKDGESELAKKVKANEEAIKNLTEKGIDKEAFKKEFEELMKGMGVDIAALSGRITSLVLLPDYVSDNGGALPLLNFSPLSTACGDIVPAVMVKYVVNPSTATEDNIDTENLKFRYNDPISMSGRKNTEGVDQKAEFVSLKDGILTVKATLNTEKLHTGEGKDNSENRIDQLMLEVPMKDGAVVSSDWAKVVYKATTAAIVKTPKKVSTDNWSDYELVKTLEEAKDLRVDSPTVIEMAYDAKLKLDSVVKATYSDWKDLKPSDYGLGFAFDLKDEDGNKIVYNIGDNNTDQQEFITVADGVASMKVYGKDKPNRAAIGRTPIVHVMLKKADGCVAREGFIKISVVEKEIPAVDPVTFEPEGKTYSARCSTSTDEGGYQVVHTVGTKEMNEEFYYAVNMSKEEFHGDGTNRYVFANLDGGVGTIEEKKDINPAGKTSYNLVYKLTEEEVWENAGKEVWKKGTYTYGGSVIEVKFKVTIVKPSVTLDVLLDNFWYNNSALEKSGENGVHNTIVHNVAVPDAGSETSADATYSNNINNAFKSTDAGLLDAGNYEYEYVFDEENQPIQGAYVADGGKSLMYQNKKVATIDKTDSGDMLTYADTDVAKELLNKGPQYSRAKVKLVVKNSCGKELDVVVKKLEEKNKFNVIFLRPINVEGVSPEHFIDGVDFGKEGSFIDLKKIAKLSDWRNFVTGTKKYNFLPDNENYYSYYGVTDIKVDLENIKTEGLTIGGRAISTLPATIEITQPGKNKNYKGDTDTNFPYGVLTYKNGGNNLGQEFWLVLPVTVTYKWGEVVVKEVRVKVASTKNARKAAK